jgi:hypothetical protein
LPAAASPEPRRVSGLGKHSKYLQSEEMDEIYEGRTRLRDQTSWSITPHRTTLPFPGFIHFSLEKYEQNRGEKKVHALKKYTFILHITLLI